MQQGQDKVGQGTRNLGCEDPKVFLLSGRVLKEERGEHKNGERPSFPNSVPCTYPTHFFVFSWIHFDPQKYSQHVGVWGIVSLSLFFSSPRPIIGMHGQRVVYTTNVAAMISTARPIKEKEERANKSDPTLASICLGDRALSSFSSSFLIPPLLWLPSTPAQKASPRWANLRRCCNGGHWISFFD